MAILTKTQLKDGKLWRRRVYYAHIPKCAGTSLYIAFLRAGWQIENVNLHPKMGLGPKVYEEFGISQFQRRGSVETLGKRSIQHAPFNVWRLWGQFDESFAIVRNPRDRYLSALKFQYMGRTRGKADFEEFRAKTLSVLQRGWRARRRHFDGHFAPQTDFLGPATQTYRFESDFVEKLAGQYGLASAAFPELNTAQTSDINLNSSELEFISKVYKSDADKLGYEI